MFRVKAQNAVSTATSSVSLPIDASRLVNWAVHWIWTGTTRGDLKVQASLDGVNWFDFPNASKNVNSSPGQHMFQYSGGGVYVFRSVFNRTSGSGTLTAIFSGLEE